MTTHIPICYAMGQTLSPLRMRATASVMVSLASGIMGMMLAPLVIGTLNDHLNPMFGDMAIRYTMSFAILASAGAAISAFLGTRWMREDYAPPRRQSVELEAMMRQGLRGDNRRPNGASSPIVSVPRA